MREWNQNTLQVQRAWVALQTGDSLLLRGAPGLRVEAAAPPCSGQQAPLLWLTEEGEADDVFLRPGESHVLRGRGRTVASAWGPIHLRVVALASAEVRQTPSILRRLDVRRGTQRVPRSANRPSVGSAWLRV